MKLFEITKITPFPPTQHNPRAYSLYEVFQATNKSAYFRSDPNKH